MSTDGRHGTLPTRRAVRAATEPVRLSLCARIHRQTVSALYVVRLCTALLSQSVVIVLSCTARYYSVHRVVTRVPRSNQFDGQCTPAFTHYCTLYVVLRCKAALILSCMLCPVDSVDAVRLCTLLYTTRTLISHHCTLLSVVVLLATTEPVRLSLYAGLHRPILPDTSVANFSLTSCLHFTTGCTTGWVNYMQMSAVKRHLSGPARTLMTSLG